MKTAMILIKLDEVLQRKERTLYWLAQNSGVPYVTLWNLSKKETQNSINLPVLSRVCTALNCHPGDMLVYEPDAEDRAIADLMKSKEARAQGPRGQEDGAASTKTAKKASRKKGASQ